MEHAEEHAPMAQQRKDDRIESLRTELQEARRQLGHVARRIEALEGRLDAVIAQPESDSPGVVDAGGTGRAEASRLADLAAKLAAPGFDRSVFEQPAPSIPASNAAETRVEILAVNAVPSETGSAVPEAKVESGFGPQLAAFRTAEVERDGVDARKAAFRRLAGTSPGKVRGTRETSDSGGIATLEKMIGGRWYAAIGALVVVIGVGLFFRLAVQSGWIVMRPPSRCIGGAVFGLGLLGAGEWARRRWGSLAAAGLSAAGIGVIYAATFAAYGVFDLLSPGAAFMLLAAASALGIGVAARARLVSVAIVSLLGGYATPLLFWGVRGEPIVVPAYFLALLSVGLVLSAWIGGTFVKLRSLVWWGTVLAGGVWVMNQGDASPLIATVFLGLVWAAVHAELVVSSGRFGLLGTGVVPATDQDGESILSAGFGVTLDRYKLAVWRPLASSFSTSAWVFVFGVEIFRGWQLIGDWAVPAAMVLVTAPLAGVLAGHLRVLRDRPETDAQRLGACLMLQTGALIIAAVALGTSGAAQTISWISMGVAVVLAGRWLRSRGLDGYGLVVLALATGRAVVWDAWVGTMNRSGTELFGLYLTPWTLLMLGLGAGWLTVGAVLRRSCEEGSAWRRRSTLALGMGIVVVFVGLLHPKAHVESATVVIATMGLVLAAAGLRLKSDGLRITSLLAVGLSSLLSVMSIAGIWKSYEGVSVGGVVFNAWSAVRTFVGLVWVRAAWKSFLNRGGAWEIAAKVSSALGVQLIALAVVNPGTAAGSASVAWAMLALGVGAVRFCESRLAFDLWAAVLGLVAFGAWLWAFPFWDIDRWDGAHAGVALHRSLWMGLAIWAVVGTLARYVLIADPTRRVRAGVIKGAWALAAIVLFAVTSVEVARSASVLSRETMAQSAAVSIWWGLFAAGLIALGFVVKPLMPRGVEPASRGLPIVRQAGLALLAAAMGKAIIFDLGHVEPIWRVVSFIGLGLLMMAVAVTYSKASARLGPPAGNTEDSV